MGKVVDENFVKHILHQLCSVMEKFETGLVLENSDVAQLVNK